MSSYSTAVTYRDFSNETQKFFRGRSVTVTGGDGFIGSHVVEQLLSLGAQPIVPTRKMESENLKHIANKVDFYYGADLADRATCRKVMHNCDIIMHLAADIGGLGYNMYRPGTIFDANMSITLNVFRTAVEYNASQLLACSSACVYPRNSTLPTPESEGFRDRPEPTNAGYGWAKRMSEFLAESYAKETGLSVAIARPYNAYGPRDIFDQAKSHVIPALILKAIEARDGVFDVWGDGSASRSFLFVDDAARGLIEITAKSPGSLPINLGRNEETSIAYLAETIASIVGNITGCKPSARFLEDAPTGQPRRICDTSLAKERLGFSAKVSLVEGLKRTVQWFLAR